MRILLLLTACLAAGVASEKKIVCYFGSWAVYRPGSGQISIDNIDPTLCTHLIYTFVGIQGNDVKALDPWQDLPDDGGKDGFRRFNALRKRNPQLKTLVAIGGWNEGSAKYSQMASNGASREEFANNVVKFVKQWGFNGFDVDWEYPAQRDGSPQDYKNYVELLKVLRKHLNREGLLLSAAVAAPESSASISYNIPEISKYLDFINLMTYDFHGKWDPVTGINSPLYPSSSDSWVNNQWTVKAAVEYWLKWGAPKEKLIVGIPFYGRSFTLVDPSQNGIGAPARGGGVAGPYTREPGTLGYNEICESQSRWTVVYHPEHKTPYAFQGDQWVGYDNAQSVREKANFISSMGLGGGMVWSIETDDFRGICGEKYILLKTLNSALGGGSGGGSNGGSGEAEVGEGGGSGIGEGGDGGNGGGSGSGDGGGDSNGGGGGSGGGGGGGDGGSGGGSNGGAECTAAGNIPDPNSCGFLQCAPNGAGGYDKIPVPCPGGTCYDPGLGVCNWAL